MKKSELVRNIIAAAKLVGKGPEDIVGEAMAATGHPRQLTRAYIKNNWPKVADPTDTLAAIAEEYTADLGDVTPLLFTDTPSEGNDSPAAPVAAVDPAQAKRDAANARKRAARAAAKAAVTEAA